MRSFKLRIAYDGSRFHGWQTQSGQRTVQGVLGGAVGATMKDERVRLEGAGRTDAGVHARGQVVSFEADTSLPARALVPLLNQKLPGDVRVRAAAEVGPGFSARRSALARRYAYRLLREDDILLGRFAWFPRRAFDLDRLARATRALEGEHDFTAFRATGSAPVTPRCRVTRATWSRDGDAACLDIVADHFLYHMVRSIVGTALAVADERDPAAAMAAVLEARDRARVGATVPAHGLCLEEVYYPEEYRA